MATACGPTPTPEGPDLQAGPAVCQEGPARPSGEVEPTHATIGATSNAIRRGDEHLWIVESGSNTVSRLDPKTGEFDAEFIDVGNGHNPYDAAVAPDDDRIYITNYLAGTVTVADTQTGEVLADIGGQTLKTPQGIAVAGDWLYVTDTNYQGTDPVFGTGELTIIDRRTNEVTGTVTTRWKNPQFARTVPTPDGPRVAVTSSGVIDLGTEPPRPTSQGGLELWRPNGKADSAQRETFSLNWTEESTVGAPGRALPTADGSHLYFTSGTDGVVFTFDLEAGMWRRDATNPIRLYETDRPALHHGAVGPGGLLYVTAFNRDALYLFDPTCDRKLAGPIDLGTSDQRIEGPHGVVPVSTADGIAAWYVMSISSALGMARLHHPS